MSRKICVIGTGYVGLITAIGLSDFGNHVIGVDIDKKKIENLQKGISPIYEPGIEEYLMRNLTSGRLVFSTDIDRAIQESKIIFIGVGTPPKENGEADLSYVFDVTKTIARNLNNYKIVVTKSTVPIGTNKKIKEIIKEKSGKKNFDVVSNPEFLREGKAIYDFFHPNRIVIGYENDKAKKIMEDIYRTLYLIQTPFVWCNLETAEMIKYASNAFLATKITFINQIANLCEVVGADVHKVAKAMGMDGRISSKFLHPGPGYGGSCFPKDTMALVEIGNKYNVDMSLVKEVINANEKQKERMIKKLEKYLNLKDKKIAILGLAFKAETDDMRESPAITIINKLIEKEAKVVVHDPKAIENAKKIFNSKIKYMNNEYDVVREADALIILTEWNEYRNLDLARIKKLMKGNVLLDTRNLLDDKKAKEMGFAYEGVGRK